MVYLEFIYVCAEKQGKFHFCISIDLVWAALFIEEIAIWNVCYMYLCKKLFIVLEFSEAMIFLLTYHDIEIFFMKNISS